MVLAQWLKKCALAASGFSLLLFAVLSATQLEMPCEKKRYLLYTTERRDDLHALICKAIKSAQRSIHLHTYQITDPHVLRLLKQKADEGLIVDLTFDKKANRRKIPSPIVTHPYSGRGLMHRKILIIDETFVYLGSANMTEASLRMHDNTLIGLYDPPLAHFLLHPTGSIFEDRFYFTPSKEALHTLLAALDAAETSIAVSLFTLTHPLLVDALIRAHKRHVKTHVTLDAHSLKGASKQAAATLTAAGIPVIPSKGMQLYHHKSVLIDNKTLITGSANWTKAAFNKNQDYIIILK